jgi:hypothetical protein
MDAVNSADVAERERIRIAVFLRHVWAESTHGASNLMDRAINAVERNEMDDPARAARPID